MRIRNLASVSLLALAASGLMGCGIVSKDFDGPVNFQFEVNDDDSTYEDIVTFNPDDYEDVRRNRDKIKDGQVLRININLTEVLPGNKARQVAGQVDVRRQGQGDDAWIQAVGTWSGIPLYDENGVAYVGQSFQLELTRDTQDELSHVVFEEHDPLDFRIRGYGLDDDGVRRLGPVRIRGEVEVQLHVTAGVP